MVVLNYSATIETVTTLSTYLSQTITNGNSLLGTGQAPQYGAFMTNNPLPDGYPWGKATARQTNPYTDCPKTGVTRYYDFTIGAITLAPDGYGMSPVRFQCKSDHGRT
jgi:hypothetical protein